MAIIKKLAIFIVAVLVLGLLSLYWFNPIRREEAEKANQPKPENKFYVYYPKADIKSFEFINGKNGLVVEWDYDKKEQEEAEKTALETSSLIQVNSNFLVRHRQKLRYSSTAKTMSEDEYAFIDVYDLNQEGTPKKELDLIKLVKDYLQTNKDFALTGVASNIRKIDGNDFLILNVHSNRTDYSFLIDLRTLKIVKEINEDEYVEQGLAFFALSISSDVSSNVEHIDFTFDKTDDFKNMINLAKSNPKADALFTKENSSAYQVVNSENGVVTNGRELLDVAAEFLDEGTSIYDNAYLLAKYSTQGAKTKITSYDELLSYYNGEKKSEIGY